MKKVRGFTLLSEDAIMPKRATRNSAGYDLYVPNTGKDVAIFPGEMEKITLNVAAYMQPDEVLMVFVRSSVGIKRGLVLANGTGIIDSDYYGNPDNQGNIIVALRNLSDEVQVVKSGEKVAQCIFTKYLVVDNDEPETEERIGGIGSTGK